MFRAVGAATFLAGAYAACAQTTNELPSFEVASVKRSPPQSPDQQTFTVTMDDRRPRLVTYRNVILKSLLTTAYHLEGYQIKGPSWIESEQYDIIARVPTNTPYSQRRLMLQRLLAERLQLKVHLEKRELPAYVLLVGKNPPTLHKAKVRTIGDDGTMAGSAVGGGRLDAKNQTMQGLADLLSNELHAPVVDETGIEGEYDLVLSWSMDASAGAAADEPVAESVAIALRREAGLILKKQKALVDFLVVDHVEKAPTEN